MTWQLLKCSEVFDLPAESQQIGFIRLWGCVCEDGCHVVCYQKNKTGFSEVELICFPPFQSNLHLSLIIVYKQFFLKTCGNFSQYAKLCSQAPLRLSCDVFLRYANMTFLFCDCSSVPALLLSSRSLSARERWNITCVKHYSRSQHLFGETKRKFTVSVSFITLVSLTNIWNSQIFFKISRFKY